MDLSMFSLSQIAMAMVFTGLVVVFVALVGLWWIVAAFGNLFTMKKTPSAPNPDLANTPKSSTSALSPSPSPSPSAAVSEVRQGMPPEVVAAISGAVAAMTQGQGVVKSIVPAEENAVSRRSRRRPWARAGLQQNMQSF